MSATQTVIARTTKSIMFDVTYADGNKKVLIAHSLADAVTHVSASYMVPMVSCIARSIPE